VYVGGLINCQQCCCNIADSIYTAAKQFAIAIKTDLTNALAENSTEFRSDFLCVFCTLLLEVAEFN
jgi:Fe-S-cluster containining protein